MAITKPTKPYWESDDVSGITRVTGQESGGKEFIRALFYGMFGTGKTLAASSFPGALILSLDKGEATLDSRAISAHLKSFYYGQPIFYYIAQILSDARLRKGAFAPGEQWADVQTIVIDNGTELARFLLYEIMAIEGINFDKRGHIKMTPEEGKAERDHYAVLGNRYHAILRWLRDLSDVMNVVMICLDMVDENTGQGMPNVLGSVRYDMAAAFDEVIYFTKEKSSPTSWKFVGYTQNYGQFGCKTRFGNGGKIEDVTYDKIRQSVEEGRKQWQAKQTKS